MTDSFVTQCPHCQSRFRVNHAQLSVARGVVRCGSCLQVFNAARQLLEQRAQVSAPEPEAPTTPEPIGEAPPEPPRAISQKQWTAEELDLDNLDKELAKLERREIQHTQAVGAERRQPGADRRQKEESFSASRDTVKAEEENGRPACSVSHPKSAPRHQSKSPSRPRRLRPNSAPNRPCRPTPTTSMTNRLCTPPPRMKISTRR